MNILSGFFTDDLAIDLGTVNTIVYAPTQGVVLNEPSVVAINKYSREVISVGSQALKLLGREPNDTEVHRPMRRGAIDNFEISQEFLRAIISRVQNHDHPKRSHLVIGVPGSSTPLERRSVKDAARDAKAGRVDLIDEGLAAALGAELDFDNEQAHLVVDIGGGTTNIAILASGGVINSVSLPAAGNAMDDAIKDYLRLRYAVQFGERTIEHIKRKLGSASHDKHDPHLDNDLEIVGKQLANGAAPLDEAELGRLASVRSVRRDVDCYSLAVEQPHIALPALLAMLQGHGLGLARLTTRHATLEDVFVSLTGRHLREGDNGHA